MLNNLLMNISCGPLCVSELTEQEKELLITEFGPNFAKKLHMRIAPTKKKKRTHCSRCGKKYENYERVLRRL